MELTGRVPVQDNQNPVSNEAPSSDCTEVMDAIDSSSDAPLVPGSSDASGVEKSPGATCNTYGQCCMYSTVIKPCNFCNQLCDTHEIVYRYDRRGPEVIFEEGFSPRCDTAVPLVDYLMGGIPSSYVSTTAIPPSDNPFRMVYSLHSNDLPSTIFVYQIRANNNFFNVIGSLLAFTDTPLYSEDRTKAEVVDRRIEDYRFQREILSIRAIPPENIKECQIYDKIGECEYKENTFIVENDEKYEVKETHSNARPFKYIIKH